MILRILNIITKLVNKYVQVSIQVKTFLMASLIMLSTVIAAIPMLFSDAIASGKNSDKYDNYQKYEESYYSDDENNYRPNYDGNYYYEPMKQQSSYNNNYGYDNNKQISYNNSYEI